MLPTSFTGRHTPKEGDIVLLDVQIKHNVVGLHLSMYHEVLNKSRAWVSFPPFSQELEMQKITKIKKKD